MFLSDNFVTWTNIAVFVLKGSMRLCLLDKKSRFCPQIRYIRPKYRENGEIPMLARVSCAKNPTNTPPPVTADD